MPSSRKVASHPGRQVAFRAESGHSAGAEIDTMVLDVLSRVADKWTMCVLEVLSQHRVLRFTRIGELVGSISQRMLTKTLRQLEADGLLIRTVYPEVPPRVEYRLTELGDSLCAAFCSVWLWAEAHEAELRALQQARQDGRPKAAV
ncbi:winged helix-turn-helix transcriptional regulator [Frateuria aurantia]|uniref:Putative transcriptional regulator n=1 Tax=Frateuria aurantia (strain ATCC 33424 / DSM 6220 / KCTC 2777 / LMG 1558 / NBRC 3245 / NCIMB 13370) TaxID=767434 RepID=H8L3X4_FRAAD|nr:helix-turn-helix domain-containing protein [Frateuria aurantia]AFC85568.1 putative transcriptional regulator [Frateuria aurantia DSM 6220]